MIVEITQIYRTDGYAEERLVMVLPPPQMIGRQFELTGDLVYVPPVPGTRRMTYLHADGRVTEEIL